MTENGRVQISADCICDLPEKFISEMGISLLYYYIRVGENEFQDTSEIDALNVLDYMEHSSGIAASEPPSVEEYREFFEKGRAKGPMVHICAAANMSGGYARAVEAAKGMEDVTVIDSGHVSSGHGLVVLNAAQMAKDGCGMKEIADRLPDVIQRVKSSFVVGTMKYLLRNRMIEKGLHVSRIDGIFSFVHPSLKLKNSTIKIGSIYFGSVEKAYRRYIHKCMKKHDRIDNRILFLTTAGCNQEQIGLILKEVEKYMRFERIEQVKASGTITCNCGPGAFGLLFMEKL